jgi:hypothetical protein
MCNNEKENLWSILKSNFHSILHNNEYYSNILKFMNYTENNILLYGQYGFPTDLFIDEILKNKFQLKTLYKQECIWCKDVHYIYNANFLEIDLSNPNLCKRFSTISKFLVTIIVNKHVSNAKHYIILKNINVLSQNDFSCLRILVEKYSKNVYFLCTTHQLSKIDVPIKSRFSLVRLPLFSHMEIVDVFEKVFNQDLNIHLKKQKTRDLVKAIFLSEVEKKNKEIITYEFCTLNYPPLMNFVTKLENKKNNLEIIRKMAYEMFQYNISIVDIVQDLLKIIPKKKYKILESGAYVDYVLSRTNNGREPIYLETLLCLVLL